MNKDIIWRPAPEQVEQANITRFMRKHGIADYPTLLARSVEDVRWFWDAVMKDLGIEWFKPYSRVLDDTGGFSEASWFVDGELNIVHNCVDRHAQGSRANSTALIWEGEGGETRTITFAELATEVARVAGGLLQLGVKRGEAVGLLMPLIPEVVYGMFACQKIGAVPVPIFSGYGPDAVAVRLNDAQVQVVLTVTGGSRRGKQVAIKAVVDKAAAQIPTLRKVVVLRSGETDISWVEDRDLWWDEWLAAVNPEEVQTAALSAESTALILYTSGTTGRPKGCVHTHAGCLAQMAKEVAYNLDVHPADRFFWFTDIGWMMGPWELIGALCHGATVVLFTGVPNWPQPDRLWQVVDRHQATHLGISPTAVRALKASGDEWVDGADLSSLRILGSTGEPWDDESYGWFFERVGKSRCPIINISGGTEIVGCHLAPLPIYPLKACTLQGPGLGMDVDVFNEAGESVRGEIGYLVCKQPAPSMTKGFLNDRQRYLDTYFSKWSGIWNHGDWAFVDEDGFWFLQGRSDDTIKVAGKRVGPAEIEGELIKHPAVVEAAAIGVPDKIKGAAIVCFVVLKPEVAANVNELQKLRSILKKQVAVALGKPMQPQDIRFVDMLPKTRSAKIMRGTIRKVWLGEDLGDISAVENPKTLAALQHSL